MASKFEQGLRLLADCSQGIEPFRAKSEFASGLLNDFDEDALGL